MGELATLIGKIGPEGAINYFRSEKGQAYLKKKSYGKNFFCNGILNEKALRALVYEYC